MDAFTGREMNVEQLTKATKASAVCRFVFMFKLILVKIGKEMERDVKGKPSR